MIYAGPWAAIVNYVVTDAVTFNGSFYIATANNVNAQPDTHPTSWSLLAAAGAAGPQGAVGPAGPAGGTSITLPLALAQGGTGVAAANAAAARAGIDAAASGANSDITALTGIPQISIVNPGGIFGPSITVGVGAQQTQINALSITTGAVSAGQLTASKNVYVGGVLTLDSSSSGDLSIGSDPATPTITVVTRINSGLKVAGAVPTCVAGEIGFGAATASTASDGGGQVIPAHVLFYIMVNNQGTLGKIPVLAV